jgi:hypothetical protein
MKMKILAYNCLKYSVVFLKITILVIILVHYIMLYARHSNINQINIQRNDQLTMEYHNISLLTRLTVLARNSSDTNDNQLKCFMQRIIKTVFNPLSYDTVDIELFQSHLNKNSDQDFSIKNNVRFTESLHYNSLINNIKFANFLNMNIMAWLTNILVVSLLILIKPKTSRESHLNIHLIINCFGFISTLVTNTIYLTILRNLLLNSDAENISFLRSISTFYPNGNINDLKVKLNNVILKVNLLFILSSIVLLTFYGYKTFESKIFNDHFINISKISLLFLYLIINKFLL